MSHPSGGIMFVYALTQPIDDFDALTPLPDWIAADPAARTRWALQAVLALADAATQVRWDGDMRHLPSVGAVLTPPDAIPYLTIKQDNNGTTFVISGVELPWPAGTIDATARTRPRPIGAWTPPHQPGHPANPTTPRPPHRRLRHRSALLNRRHGATRTDAQRSARPSGGAENSPTLITASGQTWRRNPRTFGARSHERSHIGQTR
ncbi:hypothetical protein GCM10023170_098870 [Phytohabitans houttuyneae]|uniref:Uncharacterized protein n=1 Tax=Phytohabitans houttuyneae TaxID=1076126 RepID=A0A6V8K965_9ACTN|nr:hypothetical protein Phou_014550 [Phytohabitans houttuyneae]